MKEIALKLRLTLPEYDTLVECVADELHRSAVFAGDVSALAATCSSLLEKIKEARLASATCATCQLCEPWREKQLETGNRDLALCFGAGLPPSEAFLSGPACRKYLPNTEEP